jgi:hypothetical protein
MLHGWAKICILAWRTKKQKVVKSTLDELHCHKKLEQLDSDSWLWRTFPKVMLSIPSWIYVSGAKSKSSESDTQLTTLRHSKRRRIHCLALPRSAPLHRLPWSIGLSTLMFSGTYRPLCGEHCAMEYVRGPDGDDGRRKVEDMSKSRWRARVQRMFSYHRIQVLASVKYDIKTRYPCPKQAPVTLLARDNGQTWERSAHLGLL